MIERLFFYHEEDGRKIEFEFHCSNGNGVIVLEGTEYSVEHFRYPEMRAENNRRLVFPAFDSWKIFESNDIERKNVLVILTKRDEEENCEAYEYGAKCQAIRRCDNDPMVAIAKVLFILKNKDTNT